LPLLILDSELTQVGVRQSKEKGSYRQLHDVTHDPVNFNPVVYPNVELASFDEAERIEIVRDIHVADPLCMAEFEIIRNN